jgi:HEAT repeat protein
MAAKKRSVEHDDSDFENAFDPDDIDLDAWRDDDDIDNNDDEGEAAALTAGHRHDYYTRHLPELDGEADLDDTADVGADHRPTWTVETLLQRLATAPDATPLNEYFAFSDLTRLQAEVVRRAWPTLAPETRRSVLEILLEGAETYLDIDLNVFLVTILDDAEADVRQLVLETLAESEPTPEMLGPIIQRLQRDEDDDVRAAAAAALGYYVLAGELDELDAALAMRAEESLVAVLTDPAEAILVQRRALESIAYSGEIGVRQFIEDAYYAPYEELRLGALVAMGRSADIRWRKLVRAELGNPSAAMRAEAAVACGELEAKTALSDLLALLEDDESIVRLAAIFALGRLGGKPARRALAEIAASDVEEAEAAELALEDMLFYAGEDAATYPLFEDAGEEEEFDDLDPWDEWSDDDDDDDLGEYA